MHRDRRGECGRKAGVDDMDEGRKRTQLAEWL